MEVLASSHVTRPNLWLDKYDVLLNEFSLIECNSMFDHTGACGSCPSSTTTMKMGIERVLKEKSGEAVRQVFDEPQNTVITVEVGTQFFFSFWLKNLACRVDDYRYHMIIGCERASLTY